MLRAGVEPATVASQAITATSPARSRMSVAVVKCGRRAASKPLSPKALYARDNRATPARDRQTRQDSNPDPRGWSSRCFRYTTDL
jgi:hypothetical protein